MPMTNTLVTPANRIEIVEEESFSHGDIAPSDPNSAGYRERAWRTKSVHTRPQKQQNRSTSSKTSINPHTMLNTVPEPLPLDIAMASADKPPVESRAWRTRSVHSRPKKESFDYKQHKHAVGLLHTLETLKERVGIARPKSESRAWRGKSVHTRPTKDNTTKAPAQDIMTHRVRNISVIEEGRPHKSQALSDTLLTLVEQE